MTRLHCDIYSVTLVGVKLANTHDTYFKGKPKIFGLGSGLEDDEGLVLESD